MKSPWNPMKSHQLPLNRQFCWWNPPQKPIIRWWSLTLGAGCGMAGHQGYDPKRSQTFAKGRLVQVQQGQVGIGKIMRFASFLGVPSGNLT